MTIAYIKDGKYHTTQQFISRLGSRCAIKTRDGEFVDAIYCQSSFLPYASAEGEALFDCTDDAYDAKEALEAYYAGFSHKERAKDPELPMNVYLDEFGRITIKKEKVHVRKKTKKGD